MKTALHSPEEIRQRVWMELSRAALDRHHEWRTPVLATLGIDGTPNARTVVLRHVDAHALTLGFYTDSRSPKIAELAAQPQATLLFWSTRLNWQLRVRVTVTVLTSGPQVEAVWAKVKQSHAAGDYLTALAPGDKLATCVPEPIDTNGLHHLALLNTQVQEMDWLELARSGHRRARMNAQTWEWLTP